MANIVVYRDPVGVSVPEVYQISGEANLADWMLNHLTDNILGLHCQIILNGREIVNSETMTIDQCCNGAAIKVGLFDNVTFRFRPQAELSIYAILAIVAVSAAVLTIALAPKPKIPGQADSGSGDRNNNQLNSAANSYRPREAIPDIAGQVISYPDFAQRSYYEYDGTGRRVYNEWFCVGVGRYEFGHPKENETEFSDIPGYQCAIFGPGEQPETLKSVIVAPSSQDVDLLSSGQQSKTVQVSSGVVNAPNYFQILDSLISALELSVGGAVSIEILVRDSEGADIFISVSDTVATIGDDFFTTVGATAPGILEGTIISGSITNSEFVPEFPWYTLSGSAIEEVWFHVIMPSGIRKGDGTIASVTVTLTIEELDEDGEPTGITYSQGAVFTGNTQEAQRSTFKFTASIDGISAAGYRARAIRITPYLGDNSLDLVVLEGIASVTSYSTSSWGDVTSINTIRSSRQRVDRGGSSKFNIEATRRLRIYDNDTGIYGAEYVATRRFCDYVFYLLHERAGVPIAQINTDELFGIHDNLTDDQLGYFDYTFSDDNIAMRERIETACNAARVRYWNEGLLWSFVRDEAKPFKSLMFNRRNLTPAASSYAQKFRRPADYDGVTVIYVDPVKNAEKRVSRRIDISGNIIAGIGIRPLEINLAGCRNDLQAINRCELEARRLIYQSIKVNDTALNDAQLARIGMRIDWVDMYDSDMFDGELLSVSGNVYTTSERFEPAGGVEYWVYVTDDSGQPGNSVRAYPRADGNKFGFEAVGLTGFYVANGAIQSGSRYFIASNSDSDASTFTVIGRGRPNERGECTIELAEYNELMYEAD